MAHQDAFEKMHSDRVLRRWFTVERQRDRKLATDELGHKLFDCRVIGVYEDCIYLAQFEDGRAERAFRIRVDVPSLSVDELI